MMLLYGNGGVGKTTFASTAPNVLMADCEGGSKYLGMRGIKMDVAVITKWSDMKDFLDAARLDKYDTIVIDPLNELMEKLMTYLKDLKDAKLVQKDGSPTMAGWGWLKNNLRNYLKVLRDIGKHLILITHVTEEKDEDKVIKRPMLMTKLSQEVVNMVDIVAYMTMIQDDAGVSKRVLYVHPESDKYVAKDRTGSLEKYNKPDFNHIYSLVSANFEKTVKASAIQQENENPLMSINPEPIKKVEQKKVEKPSIAKKAMLDAAQAVSHFTDDEFQEVVDAIEINEDQDTRVGMATEQVEKNTRLTDEQRSTLVAMFIL